MRSAWAALLMATAGANAFAQDADTVEVRVTGVSGETVFLDQGRDAGVAIGDRVLIYSRAHGILAATVRAVSRTGSSCTLDAGTLAVEIGARGEVLANRPQPEAKKPQDRETPEHPPWKNPPEEWDKENPLLAPAFSRRPEERPTQFIGRAYLRGAYVSDQVVNHNTYTVARAGLDLTVINPVSWGGAAHVRAEGNYYATKLEEGDDTSDTEPRVDTLSYEWGGLRGQPLHVEIGRFLHDELPQLGSVDGAEVSYLFGSFRVGGSAGWMPDAKRTVTLTEDLEGSLYARLTLGAREEFSAALAIQKTWHEGEADRDAALVAFDFTPSQWLSMSASAWVDWYTSDEVVKDAGFELTEAHASAIYRLNMNHGVGLFYTRIQRPDVLRDELEPEVAEFLKKNLSTYYGAYTWHRLSAHVLVDTRVSPWIDVNGENGISGEARLALQNLLFDKGEIALAAYYTDSAFSTGPGARLSVSRLFAPVYATVWYDIARYEYPATERTALQQWVHLSLDAALSETWSASLTGDYRFGDDQDSYSFSFSLEKRI